MPEEMASPQYPSNSYRSREEKRVTTKVVTSELGKKKKTMLDKISSVIFGDDAKALGEYILHDILIPSAKELIMDMVRNGLEMRMYGDGNRYRSRRDPVRSTKVAYNSMYNRDAREDRREYSQTSRSNFRFEDIIIPDRKEAEEVLTNMIDLIENYDNVGVGDFYDLVGIRSDYTDNKYGWTNLRDASVKRVREGYVLDLPRVQVLE